MSFATSRELIGSAYWRAYILKNGLATYLTELDRFRSLPAPDARQEIGELLLAQIRYFGQRGDALPEWKEAASVRHARDLWRIWSSLPVLTKRDLVMRFHPHEMVRRFGLTGRVNSTSGSTGEPTRFLHSSEMIEACVATTLYCRLRLGWRPGMATVSLWGSERDVGGVGLSRRERIKNTLSNSHVIAGFEVNADTVSTLLRLIRAYHPVALYGYTSILEFAARHVLKADESLPVGYVQTAWNGAEMLFESQSELFKRAFGVPILNWYGGRELLAMAYQTAPGAAIEIVRPYLFVEILDENDKPVAPGESGRLVWTSTVCRGTPFLRYDIGDLGSCGMQHIDESGIRALKELHGRKTGILRLRDGRMINCVFWNRLFRAFPEVEQFQVVVQTTGGIQLRLKGIPFSVEREAYLRSILRGMLSDIPLGIIFMEKIPLTREGKLTQVVVE